MAENSLSRPLPLLSMALLLLPAWLLPSFAQEQKKILTGHFEEWGIYYAGYNIANLEQNRVADHLTHLFYAFANVTSTPAPGCAIAELKMLYVDLRGLGSADVWALKDDDANGTMVKTLARGLGEGEQD